MVTIKHLRKGEYYLYIVYYSYSHFRLLKCECLRSRESFRKHASSLLGDRTQKFCVTCRVFLTSRANALSSASFKVVTSKLLHFLLWSFLYQKEKRGKKNIFFSFLCLHEG